jgi:transcriptional regulator CtsR
MYIMNEIEYILESIRQETVNDCVDRLLDQFFAEEDEMELLNPRNFGPDRDTDA